MTRRPVDLGARPCAHEMGIYKRYFDLIAAGAKTTEIRVNDSSRARLAVGSLIRFRCRDEEVLTRATRLHRYPRCCRHRHRTRRGEPGRLMSRALREAPRSLHFGAVVFY
jgi:hypothetical protein